jgi:hypothetical protein
LEKVSVFGWFFVVNCVVNRGGLHGCFLGAENMPLYLNFSVEKGLGGETKRDPPAAREDDDKKATAEASKTADPLRG